MYGQVFLRLSMLTAALSLLGGRLAPPPVAVGQCSDLAPESPELRLDGATGDGEFPRPIYRHIFVHGDATPEPWFDFDGVQPLPRSRELESGRRGLVVRADVHGELRITPRIPLPIDLADTFRVRVRSNATSDAPVRLEFELHDGYTGTRLFHPLELRQAEQLVEIAMDELRYERGRVPQADRAVSWGLRFRDPGIFEIDGIELWQRHVTARPLTEPQQLAALFSDPATVRIVHRSPFVLITDVDGLEDSAVLDALQATYQRTRSILPHLPALATDVPLLIFSDDAPYRQFWRRYSLQRGAVVQPRPHDEGYTWQGIATASYSGAYGPVRPTYVHEAHHALLERAYGLAAQGSWIFEGLANLEQLQISHQELKWVYRRGLRELPDSARLGELASGKPIAGDDYWYATLAVQWLTSHPQLAQSLDASMLAMASQGSTDLSAVARPYFGLDVDAMNEVFLAWARARYGS